MDVNAVVVLIVSSERGYDFPHGGETGLIEFVLSSCLKLRPKVKTLRITHLHSVSNSDDIIGLMWETSGVLLD